MEEARLVSESATQPKEAQQKIQPTAVGPCANIRVNPMVVNPLVPAELASLLAVLRAAGASGFQYTNPDGSQLILQLAPALEPVGAPSVEVFDDRGPGGWK